MADLTSTGYVPEQTTADAGFEPLKAGDYPVIAIESELRDTKSGTGKFLAVTFEVFEGPSKGRKYFSNYNLANPNPKAVEIGRAQLKAFSEACGKPNAKDSTELHNSPLILNLGIDKNNQNNIKAHKPYVAGQAQVSQPAAAGAASEATPSWAANN